MYQENPEKTRVTHDPGTVLFPAISLESQIPQKIIKKNAQLKMHQIYPPPPPPPICVFPQNTVTQSRIHTAQII